MKNIGIGVLGLCAVLGLVAFLGFGLQHSSKALGSTGNGSETYYNSQWLVGGNQIGLTGTLNLNTQFGTCNLIGAGSLAATSSANYDCAVSGIKPGDLVLADPPSYLTPVSLGMFVEKAVASSTAGFITFTIANGTGAASTTLSSAGWEYLTYR